MLFAAVADGVLNIPLKRDIYVGDVVPYKSKVRSNSEEVSNII